jgi:hypothetical protein
VRARCAASFALLAVSSAPPFGAKQRLVVGKGFKGIVLAAEHRGLGVVFDYAGIKHAEP